MLTATELMLEGEKLIGNYNVEIARWNGQDWSATIPPLFAILTDLRLILQPHSRKQYDPAIIPVNYITRFEPFDTNMRLGMMLYLRTGQQIGMFIPRHQGEEILNNMHTVTIPAHRADRRHHEIHLDLNTLQKLIEYFSSMR